MILAAAQCIALQGVPTPTPLASPTAISERASISDRLDALAALAKSQTGGTLGVVIWDLGTGVSVQRNGQRAFPMASVQKLPLAVLTYAAIDSGKLRADQPIVLQRSDIVTEISPIAAEYAHGRDTYEVGELVARMLRDSDNSAANALYRILGGADALNASIHAMGYEGIVFRTNEAGLIADANAGRTFERGGDNAGSPAAIALLLGDLAQGRLLSNASRQSLRDTLANVNTFPGRLRAGFPARTRLEHKTGTSAGTGDLTDATNDAGIAQSNGRSIVVVAMLQGAHGSDAQRDAIIASVAQIAYDATRLFPLQ